MPFSSSSACEASFDECFFESFDVFEKAVSYSIVAKRLWPLSHLQVGGARGQKLEVYGLQNPYPCASVPSGSAKHRQEMQQ